MTLRSLLVAEAAVRVDEQAQHWFCKTADCDVVYFRGDTGERFVTADLRVPVFEKSADPTCPVCYCFDHSVAEITSEVARTGRSAIPDEIAEKCRRGLDRCEETNPRGSCCLGNVRAVVRNAGGSAAGASGDDKACPSCSPKVGR